MSHSSVLPEYYERLSKTYVKVCFQVTVCSLTFYFNSVLPYQAIMMLLGPSTRIRIGSCSPRLPVSTFQKIMKGYITPPTTTADHAVQTEHAILEHIAFLEAALKRAEEEVTVLHGKVADLENEKSRYQNLWMGERRYSSNLVKEGFELCGGFSQPRDWESSSPYYHGMNATTPSEFCSRCCLSAVDGSALPELAGSSTMQSGKH